MGIPSAEKSLNEPQKRSVGSFNFGARPQSWTDCGLKYVMSPSGSHIYAPAGRFSSSRRNSMLLLGCPRMDVPPGIDRCTLRCERKPVTINIRPALAGLRIGSSDTVVQFIFDATADLADFVDCEVDCRDDQRIAGRVVGQFICGQ